MQLKFMFPVICACALAACGSETVVDDPTDMNQIADAMDNLPTPQAGEYQTQGEVLEFEISGASEEEVEMMRGFIALGVETSATFCMTEEMAESGFEQWSSDLQSVPEGCEFTEYSTSSNTMAGTMQCSGPDGSSGTIQLSGTITETSQDMTMEMDMANPMQEDGQMRMKVNTTAQRIGDCS